MQQSISAYQSFLNDILKEIEQHRIRAATELNSTQMHLYFTIGNAIVTKQKTEG